MRVERPQFMATNANPRSNPRYEQVPKKHNLSDETFSPLGIAFKLDWPDQMVIITYLDRSKTVHRSVLSVGHHTGPASPTLLAFNNEQGFSTDTAR